MFGKCTKMKKEIAELKAKLELKNYQIYHLGRLADFALTKDKADDLDRFYLSDIAQHAKYYVD